MTDKLDERKLGLLSVVKEILWPLEPSARAKRRAQYKNTGIFIVTSVVFYRYAKELASLIYDQDTLEDNVRMAMR